MRTRLELWSIIKKYYPYYKEPSIKDNIFYVSRSTVISDEEEKILYTDLDNYKDAYSIEEGNKILETIISSLQ